MKDYFQIIQEIGMLDKKHTDSNKYGLLKVTIQRSSQTIAGFFWIYKYFNADANKLCSLSSVDLVKLRQKVEEHGLDWVVLDVEKAAKMYEINREVQNIRLPIYKEKMKERSDRIKGIQRNTYNKRNKSGIKYVYRSRKEDAMYWIYNKRINIGDGKYDFIYFSSKTLKGLMKKANEKNIELIIVDQDKYQKSLKIDEV